MEVRSMKVSLFVVAVAEEDDDAQWNSLPEELAVALRTFCEENLDWNSKEFAVEPIFDRDVSFDNVDVVDQGDHEWDAWREFGLNACVDIIGDYKQGKIRWKGVDII